MGLKKTPEKRVEPLISHFAQGLVVQTAESQVLFSSNADLISLKNRHFLNILLGEMPKWSCTKCEEGECRIPVPVPLALLFHGIAFTQTRPKRILCSGEGNYNGCSCNQLLVVW